jgi:hypothetical protein
MHAAATPVLIWAFGLIFFNFQPAAI